MRASQKIALGLGAMAVVVQAQIASATFDYVGTPTPVFPVAGPLIPSVTQVPGKEYAYLVGSNLSVAGPAPYGFDPGQTQRFDGLGGDTDGSDFSSTANVDAMAAATDALFTAVITNTAALLISQSGDIADSSEIPIKVESVAGGTGTWATWAQVDLEGATFGAPPGPMPGEFEGLEVWGSDTTPDTDRVSFVGEPGGVSVWGGGGAIPLVTQTFIHTILTTDPAFAQDFGSGPVFWDGEVTDVDVDGLMYLENLLLGDPDAFDPALDSLIFSIRPTTTGTTFNFDGGEIMVWAIAPGIGIAGYLSHGGHLWDTAFDVAGTFGGLENIDGIEAVSFIPEPSAGVITALACMAMITRRQRTTAR